MPVKYTSNSATTGDVVGPGSGTDNAVARWDGATGKLLQNSVVLIGDTGDVSGVKNISMSELISFISGTIFSNGFYQVGVDIIDIYRSLTFQVPSGLGFKFTMDGATKLSLLGAINAPTLNLNAATFETPKFNISSDDISHGLTSFLPTNVFYQVSPYSSSNGGAWIQAASEGSNAGLVITAVTGATSTTATAGPLFIDLLKSDGATGTQALVSTDTAFDIYSAATQLLSMKGNGNLGLGTNNPICSLHLVRGTQNGVLINLAPASIVTGDSILNLNLPSVTGFCYGMNIAGTATTGILSQIQNFSTVSTANAYNKLITSSTGGDPAFVMTVSGVLDWTAGVDNSTTGDDFKISRGAVLGINDCLIINSNLQTLIKQPYVAKTANYTLSAATDGTVNCTSGTFTLTLPTAVGIAGATFNLKNSGVGTITINTTSAQTVDGQASGFWTLSSKTNMTVQSDGANWIIL